jgi:hypothetical protein
MARALRIERPGGRYHVTARGNARRRIFRNDADRFHFLELLSELGERFGVRVHAYALMDNHYHLLLEFVSRACRWQAAPGLGVAGAIGSFARWRSFAHLHGGWGHDAALRLGRRAGRMRLAELGGLAGGLDRAVVSKAVARFGRRLSSDASARAVGAIQNQLSKSQDLTPMLDVA